jgi:integrative and conjugative element protein (TIGR02256 family)
MGFSGGGYPAHHVVEHSVAKCDLLVAADAADLILRLSQRDWPLETGGALAGFATPEMIVITHATGPGPSAERRRSSFQRDGEFTQEAVDQIFEKTARCSDYIGEWHSHPAPVGPSTIDISAMAMISRSPEYRCPKPIMVIAQRSRWRKWRLLGFQWIDETLHHLSVRVQSAEQLPHPVTPGDA